ncbi:MAG: NUDIX hydrolase [Candidatus Paceibacterota bacterium]
MNKKVFTSHRQAITACAFIYHNFDDVIKVFLPKRADTKKFLPSVFEMPGGHIDWGEDIIEGLEREIMEEHGMRIKVGDPFAVFTYLNEVKGFHSIEVIYFANFKDPIADIKLNPEDHSEFKWFSECEIESISQISEAELKGIRKGFAILSGKKLLA